MFILAFIWIFEISLAVFANGWLNSPHLWAKPVEIKRYHDTNCITDLLAVKALTAAKARAVALNDNAYYTLRKKEIELLRLKCINWASDYNSRFHKNCKNTKLELTPFILDFCSMIFLTVILRKTLKIYLILVIFFGLFTVVVNIYTITELSINFVNQDNFQSQGYIDSAKTCQYTGYIFKFKILFHTISILTLILFGVISFNLINENVPKKSSSRSNRKNIKLRRKAVSSGSSSGSWWFFNFP